MESTYITACTEVYRWDVYWVVLLRFRPTSRMVEQIYRHKDNGGVVNQWERPVPCWVLPIKNSLNNLLNIQDPTSQYNLPEKYNRDLVLWLNGFNDWNIGLLFLFIMLVSCAGLSLVQSDFIWCKKAPFILLKKFFFYSCVFAGYFFLIT